MLRLVGRLVLVAAVVAIGALVVGSLPSSHRSRGRAVSIRTVTEPRARALSRPSVPAIKASEVRTEPARDRAKKATQVAAFEAARLANSMCAQVAVAREIVVDIRRQELWACQGKQAVLSTLVTTGAVDLDEATPQGTWPIYSKQTDRWLSGPGYNDKVNFWMPFYGGDGIHDAPWQTFPDGSPLYRSGGSHGCVQVDTAVMAQLYSWASVGTTVHVQA